MPLPLFFEMIRYFPVSLVLFINVTICCSGDRVAVGDGISVAACVGANVGFAVGVMAGVAGVQPINNDRIIKRTVLLNFMPFSLKRKYDL